MVRKLRIFLAALLLIPVLTSNAYAFSTDGESALNPSRPRSDWCSFYWNGNWIVWQC